jgi:hypothetical protein
MMIDRECEICGNFTQDVWTLSLYDEKERIFLSGHKSCVDSVDEKVKKIKDLEKKSVQKVIKELGLF